MRLQNTVHTKIYRETAEKKQRHVVLVSTEKQIIFSRDEW